MGPTESVTLSAIHQRCDHVVWAWRHLSPLRMLATRSPCIYPVGRRSVWGAQCHPRHGAKGCALCHCLWLSHTCFSFLTVRVCFTVSSFAWSIGFYFMIHVAGDAAQANPFDKYVKRYQTIMPWIFSLCL